MATIKQVLAAISQDGTLGPNQKRFVTEAVIRAQTWVDLNAPRTPRKVTNAKNLVTLQEWEAVNGQLAPSQMVKWIMDNKLDLRMLSAMVGEFRQEMLAKGKQYANFKAAFQTYLAKGYLSKTFTQCCAVAQGTVLHTKGVNL